MKMRMKNNRIARRSLIWLIVVMLVLVPFTTYAAYMRSQYVKRVVSTIGSIGNRFSSNRLNQIESDQSTFEFRMLPVQGEVPVEGIDRQMSICNYPQGMNTAYYSKTIVYDLVAELVTNASETPIFDDQNEINDYYIVDSSNNIHHFAADSQGKLKLSIDNESLRGGRASEIEYTLHFPDVDTGVYMKIFARPTTNQGSSYSQPSDLMSLGAIIGATTIEHGESTNWSGVLVEPRANGKLVSDYDAFNYTISGSGAGTITLKWKSAMIDCYYEHNSGISSLTPTGPDSDGYMTLTYAVTADQSINRYSFQLYKAEDSDWSTITSYSMIANDDNANSPLVMFTFEESSDENNGG